MTYSLTGMTTLGTVTDESSNKDAGIFQMPLPASDSDEAILLDLFGAFRTITISGVYVATTTNDYTITSIGGTAWASCTTEQKLKANITMFISELDALVDGSQSSKTYHSDKSAAETVVHDGVSITGSYNVLVTNVVWKGEPGAVNQVNYTITMFEGNV